jgi:hypothetical protein
VIDRNRTYICTNPSCEQNSATITIEGEQVGPFLAWPTLICAGCGMTPWLIVDGQPVIHRR